MSRYYSYIDTTVGLGSTTVDGMLSNGNEYGVVPSIDIVARNITATGAFIGTLGNDNSLFSDIRVTGIATIGIVTGAVYYGDGSNLTGISAGGFGPNDSINTTGIITASAFHGDGSSLTGISSFSGSYNDLSNKPTIPTNNNQLSNGAEYVTSSGTVALAQGLTGTPNITAGVVNATSFIGDGSGLTGISTSGASVSVSATAPSSPTQGDLWYDSGDGRTYIYYTDSDSSQWVDASPATSGLTTDISANNLTVSGISTFGSATFAGTVAINNSSGVQQAFVSNDGSFGAAWGQLGSSRATYISGLDGKHYIGFNGTANSGTIKFDPSDGSITAAGAGSFPRLALKPTGDGDAYIQAINQTTGKAVANYFGSGDIALGSDLVAATLINLKGSNGSATFNGVCTVGDRLVCNKDGANSNTQTSFISYQADGATAGVSFTAGGSATFADAVYAKSIDVTQPTSGYTFIGRKADSTATFFVEDTGSATFAGQVTTGDASGNTNTSGVGIGSPGYVSVNHFNRPNQNCIQISDTTTNTVKFGVTGSGSAFFNSQVQVNGDMRKSTAAGTLKLVMLDDSLRLFNTPVTYNDWTIRLKTNGDAAFNGTVTATVVPPSDARFKENITPAKPQLADVVALGGILKNYNWNEDAPVNDEIRATRQIGLIAQEVEAICPSITKDIARTKQGAELTPAEVDSEGVETKAATYEQLDDSYKGISTDALIMKLIGAVTELTAKVEELESRE